MAQFDCYPRHEGPGFWLDCQTEFMTHFDTRFVSPLLPLDFAPVPAAHLNRELRRRAGSLAESRFTVSNALDFLLTGV